MTYDEALAYIHHVRWRGSRLGLDRIRELLDRLGNPQKRLRFLHIAGTNGKGSTAAMLESILRQAGYRTGLFISPFIERFNERIELNGAPIPDAELARLTQDVRPHAEAMADHPTEFELVTAVGLLYFLQERCDAVVLEVGLGGELDSTNVIDTPELAIITNIGLDHTAELGPEMEDIARAKAGIIKPGGTVVVYDQNERADAIFVRACQQRGARLIQTDHTQIRNLSAGLDGLTFDFGAYRALRCALIGSYQPHNAAVALTAVAALNQAGWHIDERAVRAGLAGVKWPVRFEILRRNPMFIADGGHNPQGVEAALDSVRLHFPGRRPVFLLGVMADKDVAHMFMQIVPMAHEIVTVTPNNPRALPARALAERVRAYGGMALACASVADGVQTAIERAGEEGLVCALGSLYLLGDVRSALLV